MIDFKEIDKDGEKWELFARDFLEEIGFYIESSVDRGPDGKKDLIVSEHLNGHLGKYKFKWLVSCKHFANRNSSNSVREDDEPNILERIKDFKCDGFIGFYSTVPSSGLNTRLNSLKENGDIKDYRVFDYKLIENLLMKIGYEHLMIRYFPESYIQIKPLHKIFDKYLPLNCRSCGTDLLLKTFEEGDTGLIAFADKLEIIKQEGCEEFRASHVYELYWACKGPCDSSYDKELRERKIYSSWNNMDDLIIPRYFINWVILRIVEIESKSYIYEPEALEQLKYFIKAMSQKVMRTISEKEQERLNLLSMK
jgi:hypothetical protein